MRKSLFTSAVFVTALLATPVGAQPLVQSQEGIALQNEIDQLQSQVQQLQSSSQNNGGSALGGSAPPPVVPSGGDGTPVAGGVVASLLTQVQQLQAQVQTLSGKVDELQNEVTTQNAQTQKQIGDLNFRVTGSATPGAPPPAGAPGAAPGAAPGTPGQPQALTPPATPPVQPPTPVAPPVASSADPKTQLHNAVAAYGAKNYTTSAALAAALVKSHPQAPEAYRAQYLVAQSYTASGRDQDAAIAYDNTYNMNRSGAYAPQSLLGLASSLQAIGANDEACSTLASLNSQFPTPPAGLQPRIDALSKRASCK